MSYAIKNIESKTLLTVALRGIVIFPGITTTFEVSRKASLKAVALAEENGGEIFLVTQRDISVEEPAYNDIYSVGTVSVIRHTFKLPDGNVQVMVEGVKRAEIFSLRNDGETLYGDVVVSDIDFEFDGFEAKRRMNAVKTALDEYLHYFSKPSEELMKEIQNMDDPGTFSDYVASAFVVKEADKQEILEISDPMVRLDALLDIFEREIELMELDVSIQGKTRSRLTRTQRENYLREQIRTIENELGEDEPVDSDAELAAKIKLRRLPKEIEQKLLNEVRKLSKMQFGSPEATVITSYIETCLELPWGRYTRSVPDVEKAKKVLDEDHDGLDKVKERILEFIAVKQLSPELDGQILCLVGPPGVGKTSVVRSIARALGRKYVRISLGGIRDEAEIRGHRKTYVGSMPGRIINALKLAGTLNPVILLDEVDKLTQDAHGDPTSALLEVLDKDQNKAFRDHFMEFPVDLSDCIFIATANTMQTIPLPLIDRMEIIEMSSYSEREKMSIAKNHLIPREIKRHGLKKANIRFTDDGITEIINSYTHESGVRNLEREIASVCRKVARGIAENKFKSKTVDADAVRELLGPGRFIPDKIYTTDECGVVNGLAWTELGGEMLRVEAVSMPGNGNLELTGSLGDVMKESAKAAVSYIRKHATELGIDPDFHKNLDIHIHVPEGAIPKDGPSAGVTITTALVSELSHKAVRQDAAMTGEISLTGRVLPIGGLREKSAAAYKSGVKTVYIPKDNERDLPLLDEEVRNGMTFVPVTRISEILSAVLI